MKSPIKVRYFILIYDNILRVLSLHKSIPKFLAHGGIHCILLVTLGIVAFLMIKYLFNSYVTSFNQIVYTFYGDTLHNYRLDYLAFEKDLRRRPDDTFNVNDIQLSFGYARDSSKVKKIKNIYTRENLSQRFECDLVSKVRFVKCDNVKDTLYTSPQSSYIFLAKKNQLQRTKKISNHDRYYYSLSTTKDSSHVFHRMTNAKDHVIEWGSMNPFFNFWIGINIDEDVKLNDKSYIKIKFNDIQKTNSEEGIPHPLVVENISPQPTHSDINEIVYRGKELESVIRQHGIYVSGIDPIKKEEAERKNLYVTVYLGTIIAFMLDIIVQLVLKWRKLRNAAQ